MRADLLSFKILKRRNTSKCCLENKRNEYEVLMVHIKIFCKHNLNSLIYTRVVLYYLSVGLLSKLQFAKYTNTIQSLTVNKHVRASKCSRLQSSTHKLYMCWWLGIMYFLICKRGLDLYTLYLYIGIIGVNSSYVYRMHTCYKTSDFGIHWFSSLVNNI